MMLNEKETISPLHHRHLSSPPAIHHHFLCKRIYALLKLTNSLTSICSTPPSTTGTHSGKEPPLPTVSLPGSQPLFSILLVVTAVITTLPSLSSFIRSRTVDRFFDLLRNQSFRGSIKKHCWLSNYWPRIYPVRSLTNSTLTDTWLRLKHLGILHDSIPQPADRVGHPMHVKVARRRFQSRTDTSSFGWAYCGSHNFSAVAWGRPIHRPPGMTSNEDSRNKSVLGSRLHICNYEFGIVFIVPPSENKHSADKSHSNLDDITLPFVILSPRYRPTDTPATKFAMSKLVVQEREKTVEPIEVEEEPDEDEEVLEVPNVVIDEKEDDKVYAEKLWGLS